MSGGRWPVFASLAGYRRDRIRPDVVAGITVWAVLVPEALAYAGIAGVDPVVGLYAAVPALVLYAAFGSSRQLVVGPMSATAALSAAIVAPIAAGDPGRYPALTTALALATGVVAVAAGVARLGFVAAFISEPVLKGFIVGLALTILIGQVPALLGVDGGHGNFFAETWAVLGDLGDVHGATVALGGLSLVAVLLLRRLLPRVPGSLLVVLAGIAAATWLDLPDRGVEVVGHIDPGLPRPGLPAGLSLGDYLDLLGPAVGVVLIGFAEGLGAARTYAARTGDRIDPDRELAGLGTANLGAGLCAGMVVNGSLSKTAVNGAAGARSQVSGLVVAALAVLTLLLLTGLFENLPEATLAAVVIAAVLELIDLPALARLYRVWTRRLGALYGPAARVDFLAAIAALAGVLVFDTLPGLLIGIGVSVLLLLYRASRPHVAALTSHDGLWVDRARHPELPAPDDDAVVVRVEAGLFFANADWVAEHIRSLVTEHTRLVVLDAETSPFIDVTAAGVLARLATALAGDGVTLRLARDVGQARDVLRRLSEQGVRIPVYATVDEALAAERPE
ncbi:SulP family inorganic anion transporter [Nocardia asteroides]|uniref:SulP family inorganic anion transporter n=1 Tax=Nocardia asteroides TaxID=1824 RepID=UPI001E39CBFD|nr:SulP family inorganic anion transporter [Nocardia asteroides]UGT61916.1 SulP family inorganic anion transporter [Nocardia asteroides]